MIVLQYWDTLETIAMIGILALILWMILRSIKRSKANPRLLPQTPGGRIGFYFRYLLRVVGVGLGAFLALALFVIIERSIYSFLTETAPAPSEVSIPSDLPFKVQEVTFEGGDDLKMSGWQVPSQNGATVILLHGYGTNRMVMLWHAQQLVNAGYGALLYDERATGESEGTRRSYGWEDPRDVQGAIRFIKAGRDGERVGIGGCSVGAQIALNSAAQYPELEAVWADGPATLRAQDIPPQGDAVLRLAILGNYSLDWVYQIGLDVEPPAPLVDVIGNISPRPIMLVGGAQPITIAGSEANTMVPRYAHFAGPNAQTWIIPEATHCDGPNYRPEEYAERMVKFFDTAFGITR